MSQDYGFHEPGKFNQGKAPLIRKFAVHAFPYLMAFSLLMLVVGSAWHVHDHHRDEVDACVWCLAALVVVVLAASALSKKLSPSCPGFVLPANEESSLSRPWRPQASRAPPTL